MEYYENSKPAMTATQTPAIELTSRQLEKQMEELMQLVNALDVRLASVMREPEPVVNSINAIREAPLAAQSPLAVMLRQRSQNIEEVINRLNSLLRRLEI